jgi:DNA-binding transcriptional MerR regulator
VAATQTGVYLRIGELAERAGVSVATIKFYIREGRLPPAPIKTGRTMGYYDEPYLERLRTIRTLREEHYLPLRVILAVLAERGDAPLSPGDAEILARVAPRVLERLEPGRRAAEPLPPTRQSLLAEYGLAEPDLALLEEMGLVGGEHGYTAADAELLDALRRAESAGLTRDRFPTEGLGHYVELLGELARREVRTFTQRTRAVPDAELEELALQALAHSEPIVALIRRKLILRALRAELSRTREEK